MTRFIPTKVKKKWIFLVGGTQFTSLTALLYLFYLWRVFYPGILPGNSFPSQTTRLQYFISSFQFPFTKRNRKVSVLQLKKGSRRFLTLEKDKQYMIKLDLTFSSCIGNIQITLFYFYHKSVDFIQGFDVQDAALPFQKQMQDPAKRL